jgi:archaeosortase A (PGF-CTERM-specific)
MNKTKNTSEDNKIAALFFISPTIMLIVGYFIYPFPINDVAETLIKIPMFLGLILLGIGFIIKKQGTSNQLKILGWMVFIFYWATQPKILYLGEEGDIANAFICVAGVYVLSYIAYHEWLSLIRNEKKGCLNWIAGASCIAGIIYFGIELSPLEMWLREIVAVQSAWLLSLFTGPVYIDGVNIGYKHAHILLIFACTAVQSMVIFVGVILPLPKVDFKRKIYGLLITILPVYFLNLFRNALVTYLVGEDITDFNMAHNIIGKAGSLIALVVLLYFVIKIIPEIMDDLIDLTELPKRNGPVEIGRAHV